MKKNIFQITKDHVLKARDFFIDTLFPIYCLGCKAEGVSLCDKCHENIIINNNLSCPVCKKPNEDGSYCRSCQEDEYLNGLWISADYHDSLIKEMIKNLKYHYNRSLALGLSQVLIKFLELNILDENYDFTKEYLLVPVPLHNKRLKYRGFNQSELLSHELHRILGLASLNAIKRIKNTKAQAKLSKQERLLNLKDAFICTDPNIKNKNILLIDDVSSTRATLNNCAKALKQNGAQEVWGFVLAKN